MEPILPNYFFVCTIFLYLSLNISQGHYRCKCFIRFKHSSLHYQELDHELKESLVGVIPGSNEIESFPEFSWITFFVNKISDF